MKSELVRFGVEVERETDAEVKKLARLEKRSKRSFHGLLLRRVVKMWKEHPEQLVGLKLIQPEN